ncbi:putative transcription factor OFP family [Helianthus annuus]|nr:putative transcription factor OFP family [Helianthus annuus]KAJ0540676.1 putative transcription factor OFP family [Helianthus annuus]KAJ0705823.1 putative transcription factor OFP family [Helianthus annuus]KAJ0709955.1 putative transcription factor OFP family [Helianthus annuus]KAJ0751803.1 putative transcription factor OFP family [Helianthus annuus]
MDGFAVAKDSSDPYEDFRASMVDMIVEKEIFSVEELENLVECFLSLNSEEHHKVIFEVFAEIWEALITDLEKRE